MKTIVLQQKRELAHLLSQPYQRRHVMEHALTFVDAPIIKLITGPRRAGKSVFALQLLAERPFAYLNFDDATLLNNWDEDLVIEALAEVYPGYTHLLLDEVQNLDNWHLWVSKLKRRGANLVITGSNSKMLSAEMATALTGRYVEIGMLPFSLTEYLSFRHINTSPQLPEDRGLLLAEVDGYLRGGGFPEVATARNMVKSYVGTLFDSIILKDVAQRYRIRKTHELYGLANYLLTNYCNYFSFNDIAHALGIASVTTVTRFCDALAEPYLFYYLPRFNNKLKLMQRAPRKVYVSDNGFVLARSVELSANSGRLLENMVAIELLRRGWRMGESMFYYRTRNDREIDFVLRKPTGVEALVQVSYDISSPKTLQRETRALTEAAQELQCSQLIIVTWDCQQTLQEGKTTISIVPIVQFVDSNY